MGFDGCFVTCAMEFCSIVVNSSLTSILLDIRRFFLNYLSRPLRFVSRTLVDFVVRVLELLTQRFLDAFTAFVLS